MSKDDVFINVHKKTKTNQQTEAPIGSHYIEIGVIVVTPKSSVQSHHVNVAASDAKRLLTLEALFTIV